MQSPIVVRLNSRPPKSWDATRTPIYTATADAVGGEIRGDGYTPAEALGNLISQRPAAFGVILTNR